MFLQIMKIRYVRGSDVHFLSNFQTVLYTAITKRVIVSTDANYALTLSNSSFDVNKSNHDC